MPHVDHIPRRMVRRTLPPRNLKLTVVGDKGVGKTSLLKTYTHDVFPPGPYKSTIFPFISEEDYVYSKHISYSGRPILMAMWDRVYNQKEDEFIRSLQYEQTDIFLLCFSVSDIVSFWNALSVWKPEIKKHCPRAPCLLLGLKKDLRSSLRNPFSPRHVITRSMGRDLAEKMDAVTYMECSAKSKDGLKEVFCVAVQTAMKDPPPKRKDKSFDFCGSRLYRLIKLL